MYICDVSIANGNMILRKYFHNARRRLSLVLIRRYKEIFVCIFRVCNRQKILGNNRSGIFSRYKQEETCLISYRSMNV